jgi:dTDP-4-dehydrorhamnose 3,5-epimerase
LRVDKLSGVEVIKNTKFADSRGSFQRVYERSNLFKDNEIQFAQGSLSKNTLRGTVRGLHFQLFPSNEWKLVSCIKGSMVDIIVDIQSESNTYGNHISLLLNEDNPESILIPPGFAHGFQTLSDDTWVLYQMTDIHRPELASRLRYNDENLGIEWPLEVTNISDEDRVAQPWPAKY